MFSNVTSENSGKNDKTYNEGIKMILWQPIMDSNI